MRWIVRALAGAVAVAVAGVRSGQAVPGRAAFLALPRPVGGSARAAATRSSRRCCAFGSGGLLGVGLGLSRQKFFYLPAAHTDFIFAIIGEELGLVGTLAVVAAFVVIAPPERPGPSDHDERRDDRQGPDEPELLTDDGEHEVRVRRQDGRPAADSQPDARGPPEPNASSAWMIWYPRPSDPPMGRRTRASTPVGAPHDEDRDHHTEPHRTAPAATPSPNRPGRHEQRRDEDRPSWCPCSGCLMMRNAAGTRSESQRDLESRPGWAGLRDVRTSVPADRRDDRAQLRDLGGLDAHGLRSHPAGGAPLAHASPAGEVEPDDQQHQRTTSAGMIRVVQPRSSILAMTSMADEPITASIAWRIEVVHAARRWTSRPRPTTPSRSSPARPRRGTGRRASGQLPLAIGSSSPPARLTAPSSPASVAYRSRSRSQDTSPRCSYDSELVEARARGREQHHVARVLGAVARAPIASARSASHRGDRAPGRRERSGDLLGRPRRTRPRPRAARGGGRTGRRRCLVPAPSKHDERPSSKAVSALSTASGFVALESSEYSTPPTDARGLEAVLDGLERPPARRGRRRPGRSAATAAAQAARRVAHVVLAPDGQRADAGRSANGPSGPSRVSVTPVHQARRRRADRRGSPGTRGTPRSATASPRRGASVVDVDDRDVLGRPGSRTRVPCPPAYASSCPCQSMWSGVMLSSTDDTRAEAVGEAPAGKLDTSATSTVASPVTATAGWRRPDVAHRLGGDACRRPADARSRSGRDGGLAVGAGHGHPRRCGQPPRELDLGDDRDTDSRAEVMSGVRRDPGARHHQVVGAVRHRRRAGDHGHAECAQLVRPRCGIDSPAPSTAVTTTPRPRRGASRGSARPPSPTAPGRARGRVRAAAPVTTCPAGSRRCRRRCRLPRSRRSGSRSGP